MLIRKCMFAYLMHVFLTVKLQNDMGGTCLDVVNTISFPRWHLWEFQLLPFLTNTFPFSHSGRLWSRIIMGFSFSFFWWQRSCGSFCELTVDLNIFFWEWSLQYLLISLLIVSIFLIFNMTQQLINSYHYIIFLSK